MFMSMNLSGACNLFTTMRITEPLRFGLHLLRVVRCLPAAAGLSAYPRTHWAGVLQASREETAGDNRRAMGI